MDHDEGKSPNPNIAAHRHGFGAERTVCDMGRRLALGCFALSSVVVLSWLCACGPAATPKTPKVSGRPIEFAYVGEGDTTFSSKNTRGRVTAVAFVTTYDLASQLLLRRLNETIRGTKPRANAGAVVMEAPKYGVFTSTFRDTLGLAFPVTMADYATLQGRGPFGEIDYIPTLVVLDPAGREVSRHRGQMTQAELQDALSNARN